MFNRLRISNATIASYLLLWALSVALNSNETALCGTVPCKCHRFALSSRLESAHFTLQHTAHSLSLSHTRTHTRSHMCFCACARSFVLPYRWGKSKNVQHKFKQILFTMRPTQIRRWEFFFSHVTQLGWIAHTTKIYIRQILFAMRSACNKWFRSS